MNIFHGRLSFKRLILSSCRNICSKLFRSFFFFFFFGSKIFNPYPPPTINIFDAERIIIPRFNQRGFNKWCWQCTPQMTCELCKAWWGDVIPLSECKGERTFNQLSHSRKYVTVFGIIFFERYMWLRKKTSLLGKNFPSHGDKLLLKFVFDDIDYGRLNLLFRISRKSTNNASKNWITCVIN